MLLNNSAYVGILIGASIGYFLILLIIIIFVARCMIRNSLREMQSPNIVYFLKKKVLQYLRGIGSEDDIHRMNMPPPLMPPPPPPTLPPRTLPPPATYTQEPRYTPLPQEKKPAYD